MPDTWTTLAREHGRKAVMSLSIDDATLEAETQRQAAEIFPLIKAQMTRHDGLALD